MRNGRDSPGGRYRESMQKRDFPELRDGREFGLRDNLLSC